MGRIIPESFNLRSLRNDAERAVVSSLRDRLNDGWLIIPSLKIRSGRDYELDVVLIHEGYGIVDVEVKGHRVKVVNGIWHDGVGEMSPQPFTQAENNSYMLRDVLRARFPTEFRHLKVHYAVALPNTTSITGNLPPAFPRELILLQSDIDEPARAIQNIFATGHVTERLTDRHIEAVVDFLYPDIDFEWNTSIRRSRTSTELDARCATQIRALERLDRNRRVLVTGGAGSGKTRLAMAWARRAYSRDERVLLTCFNEPLADQIRDFLPRDPDLTIGPFLRVASELNGMPPIEVPTEMTPEETKRFWDVSAVGHLHANWPLITDRFDTIVIDEAQDFSPAWLAQLEALLDPEGPRRVLMVADAAQDIFNRGFSLPTASDGWTIAELLDNSRNTHQIAEHLRFFLGGSPSPRDLPDGEGISFHEADTSDGLDVLSGLIQNLSEEEGTLAVIVQRREWRQIIRGELGLGGWELRHEGPICESVRRLKGTEFDRVVIFDPEGDMDDRSLYVAVSRAIHRLDYVAPRRVAERFGIHK